jgi:hypothetical protein
MATSLAPIISISLIDTITTGNTKVYGPVSNAYTVAACLSQNVAAAKTKVEVGTWNGSAFSAEATIADGSDGAAGAIALKAATLPLVTTAIASGKYIRVSAVDQSSTSIVLECRATTSATIPTVL